MLQVIRKIKRSIVENYNQVYLKQFWKAKKIYGLPSKEKYFIIRRNGWKIGLFSYFLTNLGWIKYAVENDYIPVIDMSTYPNIYLKKEDVNTLNVWEKFFEQPYQFQLNNIKWKTRYVSSGDEPEEFPIYFSQLFDVESEEYKMWKGYVDKYIRYSNEAKEEINKAYEKLIKKDDKVLGVLCRGTDYTAVKPHNHPVQPDVEEVMEKAEELLTNKVYNKIFLATEDQEVWECFRERFGEKVISNVKERFHYNQAKYLVNYMPETTAERLNKGMEYLVSIAILAKCEGFIGGQTSGTVGAMLLTEGFEDLHIWDLGLYP